ncbi:hypothetical protein [Actinoplanes sp. NPDC049802]|uniref:hypothetical protein n=1 Tax=Actinoplanes sp. NPDC049802 TaxID=3154742 RepID=UPI0033E9AB7A
MAPTLASRKDLMSDPSSSPAHRRSRPWQNNRAVAIGAGLLLALILLFSVLAYCANRAGDRPPAAGPASSAPPASPDPGASDPGGPAPSGPIPSGTIPNEPHPSGSQPGGADPGPSGGGNGSVPPGAGGSGSTESPEVTAEPKPTPSGGVDTGGGGLVDGRRLALLVTGVFLLVVAAGAGAYSMRRPNHR